MNIVKKEIVQNLKIVIIWGNIILLFLLMYALANSFIIKENNPILDLINKFPKELLKAFNIELELLSKPEGFFGTEGMTFMYIFFGILSALITSKIFASEFDEKTIEYLLLKPISKTKLFIEKYFSVFIILLIWAIVFFISEHDFFPTYIENFNTKILNIFFIYILTTSIFFSSISVLFSNIFKKRKITNSLSISLVFIMIFLESITKGVENFEFLRKFSIFYYLSTIEVVKTSTINLIGVITFLIFSFVILGFSLYIFKKEDIKI